jgi:hypothetical protein
MEALERCTVRACYGTAALDTPLCHDCLATLRDEGRGALAEQIVYLWSRENRDRRLVPMAEALTEAKRILYAAAARTATPPVAAPAAMADVAILPPCPPEADTPPRHQQTIF